jgi:hypothetical protein
MYSEYSTLKLKNASVSWLTNLKTYLVGSYMIFRFESRHEGRNLEAGSELVKGGARGRS